MSQIICNNEFEINYFNAIGSDYLKYFIEQDQTSDLILIVPTGKLVRRLHRKIVKMYFDFHKKPIKSLKIFNLNKLIGTIHNYIFTKSTYIGISDFYVNLIIENILRSSDNLFYKIGDDNYNSFLVEKVKNTIISFKKNNITIESLDEELKNELENNLESSFFDKRKFIEILNIYKEYQNNTGTALIDEAEFFIRTNKYLKDANADMVLKKIFGENCKFIFDGFSEFNEVDLSFLSVLSKSQIPTAIYFNYDLLRGPSFGTYESSIVYLFNIGFLHKNNDDLVFNNINTPEKDLDAKPSDYIRRWLFKNKKSDNYTKLQNVLNIYSFQDKKNEVDSIAKLIKYITSQSYNIQYKDQDKIKLKDICICTRKPQEYSSLFRESLIRNKIPNDISDRFNLSESTITTYLIKFLEQFNKQIRLNTFVETIKNDFFGLEHFDKSNIINLTECLIKIKARRIKIDSNLFQKEISDLQKYILKISSNKYLNEEKVNNYLKNAEIALNDLKFLSLNYPTFNETLNINEFKNGLISLIKILGIVNSLKSFKIENNYFENLSNFDSIFIDIEVEKNSRALNKFIEVLEEFSNVTKLNDENKLVNYKFKDLLKNFKNLIKSAKYQIRESIDYGVTVTSIEQTRGIPYKVIILCGAVDGIFPIPYLTDYFVGKDLKSSEERHRLSEQLLFYQFLSNGEDYFEKNKKIYITSFKYDDDRLQNRSFFTNELLKIVKPESEIDFTVSNTQIPDWYFAITDSNDSKYLDLNSTNIFKKFTLGDEVTTSLNRGLITNLNLLIEKLNNKTYSVSKLKNYLKCEFITFGNDFLDLKDNEFDFEDEILSNEKGNIIHRVMERFYITLLNEDIDVFSHPFIQRYFNSKVVKLNSNNLDKYLQLIKNLLNEVFIEYDKGNIYSTILLNQLKLVNDLNNEFNLIIKQDILDSSKYAVLFNEFSLVGKYNSREVILDNTKFNGKIDRIDINLDSLNLAEPELRLIDYKSKFNKFDFFQLNIYEYLLPKIFNDVYNININLKNSTLRLYDEKINIDIDKRNPNKENSYVLAQGAIDSIKNQNISINPKKIDKVQDFQSIKMLKINQSVCAYCNFQTFCRLKEIE